MSLADLAEPQLISGHISRITKWVVPQSQAFELTMDFFHWGGTGYLQNLVVILNFHSVCHFYFIFFINLYNKQFKFFNYFTQGVLGFWGFGVLPQNLNLKFGVFLLELHKNGKFCLSLKNKLHHFFWPNLDLGWFFTLFQWYLAILQYGNFC